MCGRLWLAAVSAGARKKERQERKEWRWGEDAQGITENRQEDKVKTVATQCLGIMMNGAVASMTYE